MQKGFVTISVLMLLSGLLMLTLYTSYTVYLQSCLSVHRKKTERKNGLIASAELYTRSFAYENWKYLLANQALPENIIISDFFRPHLSGYVLTLKNWHFTERQCCIEYTLEYQASVVAHKKTTLIKDDKMLLSWHSQTL